MPTHIVQLLRVIASNQEHLVGAHLGVARISLAHLDAHVLLELVARHELHGAHQLNHGVRLTQYGCKGARQWTLHVAHVGSRSQQMGRLDLVIVRGLLRHHDQVDCGALRVAHILHLLLPCHLQHVVNHGGHIVHTNLIPTEVPEYLPESWIIFVCLGVGVATCIAHPHIVACIGEYVGQGLLRTHEHPVGTGAEHAMHEEGNRSLACGATLSGVRYAMHGQNVIVLRLHCVTFHGVTIVLNALTL